MPDLMATLPNIVAPSVQRCKVWLTPTTRVPCSNAAKMRNPFEICSGAPNSQTDLNRKAEVHHITRTCGTGIGV